MPHKKCLIRFLFIYTINIKYDNLIYIMVLVYFNSEILL